MRVWSGLPPTFSPYHSWTGRAIYLDDLFVLENSRHNGIGSKLFEEVMKIGKMAGCNFFAPAHNYKIN